MNESSSEALLPSMGSAKDKRGVCESFAKGTFLFAKNGRLRIKVFLNLINNHTYMCDELSIGSF
jgi:hypothetical protein